MNGESNGGEGDWGQGGSRNLKPEDWEKDQASPGAVEESGICVCCQCGFRVPRDPERSCHVNICPRCSGEMGRES